MNLSQYIPINPTPVYQYFNADKDWQRTRIDEAIDLYRESLVKHLIDKLRFQQADLYQIAHDEFVTDCGQITIYGTQKKVKFANVMKDIAKLYNIYKSGDSINKKVSFVTLNFNLKQLIRARNAEDMLIELYNGIDITDTKLVDITPIDMNSLRAYLKGNENYQFRNDKVKEYHTEADGILMIAEMTNGYLPQVISESDYGRRYYKGFNLQNVSKIVRNAALGDNYEYDLNTAVYAIKLNYTSDITDQKFTYTSEYIEGGGKYKDSIRKRLAKHCFDIDENDKFFDSRLKVIKQAITAIGFGASSTGYGFYDKKHNWQPTSLSDIFSYKIKGVDGKDKTIEYTKLVDGKKVKSLDLFLQDKWMSEFVKEQQEMTKIITDMMIKEKIVTKETHPFLVDGRNALNRSRIMAYFFQKTERLIMDTTQKFIEDEGTTVLLRVHDAIYTNRKINLKELHVLLQKEFVTNKLAWLGSKIISFEEVFNMGYSYNDDDESDIDEAFSRLTGVKHVKPVVKLPTNYTHKPEGFYDGYCDYGQTEYDPENDTMIEEMTHAERREHYRIIGYNPDVMIE